MDTVALKTIITQYVQLESPNPKGWQAVRCHVCDDHTKKGLRGAFLFDGDSVVYKCWNCSHTAVYNPMENEYMPKNMIRVLDDFGIPTSEWQAVILFSPAYMNGGKKSEKPKNILDDIEPKILSLPEMFYFLRDAEPTDKLAQDAIKYLTKERGVDPKDYPYMLSKRADNPRLHKWLGRIIMPIYKNNKLIYYVGRTLYNAPLKYETPASPKEKVLFGFDKLFERNKAPLLIVEGWFDAYAIGGVATLGNIITPFQAEWLNRSKRDKIYIPDKFGNGKDAALQALGYGWQISTPDIGNNCKDMDDAVKQYGKMYVMKSIMDNTAIDFEAQIQLENYCES